VRSSQQLTYLLRRYDFPAPKLAIPWQGQGSGHRICEIMRGFILSFPGRIRTDDQREGGSSCFGDFELGGFA